MAMPSAGRSVVLTALLATALAALVVLVASLQAPVPGGGTPGESDARGEGEGEGPARGRGSGQGDAEVRTRRVEECPPTTTTPTAQAALPALLVPLPLGRRGRVFGLLLAAGVLAGCTRTECVDVRVEQVEGGGGGGGSGGTGGGLGRGDGPGTGKGTEPDPPTFNPALLWIVLVVLGAVILIALLLAAFGVGGARRRAASGASAEAAEVAGGDPEAERLLAEPLQAGALGNRQAVIAAYVEASRALAKRGVARQPWETARELAQRAPEDARDPMVRLARLYEAARHGAAEPEGDAVRQAQALAQEVARAEPPAAARAAPAPAPGAPPPEVGRGG